MTALDPAVETVLPEGTPPASEQPEADTAPAEPALEQESSQEDELPEWARKKLDKANREARNLRERLKAQEPMVAAAQEAEREQMSELDRVKADFTSLGSQLAAREVELLQTKYGISDDDLDLLGGGSYEEKESRAARIALMVQSAKQEEPVKPPTQRPVESMRPGASPTPPPVADNSYPAAWRPANRES